MARWWAIAWNTYREAIRDRILYGFLFFAVGIILFSLVLGQLSIGHHLRTVIDVGLAGISLFSVIIAVFLGVNLLHKEMQKRSIYPVLAKPVGRTAYLWGKFAGLVLVVAVQMALMVCVFVPLVAWQGGQVFSGIAWALWLVFLEAVVLTATALFFTSFSSPFLSGLFCAGIFFAGRNANLLLELAHNEKLAAFAPLFAVLSRVVPNLYLFYPSGKVIAGAHVSVHAQFVSTGYVAYTTGYALLWTVGLLAAAALVLQRRDFV